MLGLSVIFLFKSLLHVFCSLVFSVHNTCATSFKDNDNIIITMAVCLIQFTPKTKDPPKKHYWYCIRKHPPIIITRVVCLIQFTPRWINRCSRLAINSPHLIRLENRRHHIFTTAIIIHMASTIVDKLNSN